MSAEGSTSNEALCALAEEIDMWDRETFDEFLSRTADVADQVRALDTEPISPWLRGARRIAEYIDAPPSRVYALASAGRIPVERDGSNLIARRSDLDEWIRSGGGRRP